MNAQTRDPTQWLSDLLAVQQSILRQTGAGGSGTDAPAAPGNLLPWLPMTIAFVDWQQQVM
jgi:hypothetical protein